VPPVRVTLTVTVPAASETLAVEAENWTLEAGVWPCCDQLRTMEPMSPSKPSI
jgi:hypothetical protein